MGGSGAARARLSRPSPLALGRDNPTSRDMGQISRFAELTCEQSVLLGPVERQIELAQTRRGEFTGLPPLQDPLAQLRAQEGKANQTPDVAPGDAVTLGQFLERSKPAGGELLHPR